VVHAQTPVLVQDLPMPEQGPLQQRPPLHTPEAHWLLPLQAEPGALRFVQVPLPAVLLQYWALEQQFLVDVSVPQEVVPLAHWHAPVDVQTLLLPEQLELQHRPPKQYPDVHSPLLPQIEPAAFLFEQVPLPVVSLQYWLPLQQFLVEALAVPHAV
jgi:hypothetical protein